MSSERFTRATIVEGSSRIPLNVRGAEPGMLVLLSSMCVLLEMTPGSSSMPLPPTDSPSNLICHRATATGTNSRRSPPRRSLTAKSNPNPGRPIVIDPLVFGVALAKSLESRDEFVTMTRARHMALLSEDSSYQLVMERALAPINIRQPQTPTIPQWMYRDEPMSSFGEATDSSAGILPPAKRDLKSGDRMYARNGPLEELQFSQR